MITFVFFISGFAALLYQVVWQRTLFALYGINVESVTVIVTAFMLGLGVGSLLGGVLSKRPGVSALAAFAVFEAGIGLFGLFSLSLITAVGRATLQWSAPAIAVTSFLLVLAPTTLMGATLPLLVAHESRISGNVGRSVGLLYCVNTLGSAFASFAGALFLMKHIGQFGTVRIAAALNLTASLLVFLRYGLLPYRAKAAALAARSSTDRTS